MSFQRTNSRWNMLPAVYGFGLAVTVTCWWGCACISVTPSASVKVTVPWRFPSESARSSCSRETSAFKLYLTTTESLRVKLFELTLTAGMVKVKLFSVPSTVTSIGVLFPSSVIRETDSSSLSASGIRSVTLTVCPACAPSYMRRYASSFDFSGNPPAAALT